MNNKSINIPNKSEKQEIDLIIELNGRKTFVEVKGNVRDPAKYFNDRVRSNNNGKEIPIGQGHHMFVLAQQEGADLIFMTEVLNPYFSKYIYGKAGRFNVRAAFEHIE